MRDTEITLSAMRFHTRIGVLPHERELGQPVEVDLTVWVAPRRSGEDVVDYGTLYGVVAAAFAAGPIAYLEDVAETVARSTLGATPRVSRARVAVRKPHVSLGGPLAFAQVVADVERGPAA